MDVHPADAILQILNGFFQEEQGNRITSNNFGFLMARLKPHVDKLKGAQHHELYQQLSTQAEE